MSCYRQSIRKKRNEVRYKIMLTNANKENKSWRLNRDLLPPIYPQKTRTVEMRTVQNYANKYSIQRNATHKDAVRILQKCQSFITPKEPE